MTERKIFFNSNELKIKLEGLFYDTPGDKAVVVTHPHPLYGGDMHNNVVEAVLESYQESGYSTLRFNFRGTGQSEGTYDDGTGEQDDIHGAISFLVEHKKNIIDLAGYSFGAWVSAMGIKNFDKIKELIMISPPVGFMDFDFLSFNPKIRLIIGGAKDEIAPITLIREKQAIWNPDSILEVIEDADHFYFNSSNRIKTILKNFLNKRA